jgi:DNA-binding XRE family transcriptional regulator
MDTPGDRLRAARERCGYTTAKDAALAIGVAIATYTQHEKAQTHLPARRADDYARHFGVTPEYLLYGHGEVPKRIPIVNAAGEDTTRTAAFPPPPSLRTRALEADGFVHYGFVALYNPPQGNRFSPDCHGRLCVVGIAGASGAGEQQLIRIVQKGTRPDHFHLIGSGLPEIDHPILWAAPVVALVPG